MSHNLNSLSSKMILSKDGFVQDSLSLVQPSRFCSQTLCILVFLITVSIVVGVGHYWSYDGRMIAGEALKYLKTKYVTFWTAPNGPLNMVELCLQNKRGFFVFKIF